MTLGHFLMAVEGDGGAGRSGDQHVLAGAVVHHRRLGLPEGQYLGDRRPALPLTDIRRDGAYTIFYMGINVGAALGTILVGYLGETIGWAYGFGAGRHRHGAAA